MNFVKHLKKTITHVGSALSLLFFLGMGMGEKKDNISLHPEFAALEEGQGSFTGTIEEDGTNTILKDLSFTGTTKISGLRKEHGESFSDLDLEIITKISIEQPDYRGTKDDKTSSQPLFIKAKITFTSGVTETYLIPHSIEISGIETHTGAKKTWLLRTIKNLVIKERMALETREEMPGQPLQPLSNKQHNTTEPRGIVGSIVDSVKQFGNYVRSSI